MLEFANDGGPLLVAPRAPAPFWEGSELPSNGRVVSAVARTMGEVATDYDRACDVEHGAALLTAGTGWVIALSSEVAGAGWVPLSEEPSSVALVAVAGGFDASLADIYARLSDGEWTSLTDGLQIGPGGLLLLHAGDIPGSVDEVAFDASVDKGYAAIGEAITYPCPPGSYRVELIKHVQRRSATVPGEYAVLLRLTWTAPFGQSSVAAG
jgi:hypothetical protein